MTNRFNLVAVFALCTYIYVNFKLGHRSISVTTTMAYFFYLCDNNDLIISRFVVLVIVDAFMILSHARLRNASK